MSIHQMNAVWKFSKNKGSKLLLLLAIADNADDDGEAYPGIDYLAKKIRMSERHVTRMIRELGETNELAVVWGGGRGHANLYIILLDKTDVSIAEIKAKAAEENTKRETQNPDNLSVKGDKLSGNKSGKNPDNLSVKGDNLSVKGDKLSVNPDKLSVKGDIAMSPEPLEPIREPSLNHQEPDDLNFSSLDWPAILDELKNTMINGAFNHLDRTTAVIDSGILVIVTQNQYSADWINGRLKETIGRTVNAMTGQRLGIHARPKSLEDTRSS